jgi:hypothetical protein
MKIAVRTILIPTVLPRIDLRRKMPVRTGKEETGLSTNTCRVTLMYHSKTMKMKGGREGMKTTNERTKERERESLGTAQLV